MNDDIRHTLDLLAFNQVENYLIEKTLAQQMTGFTDAGLEEVAVALLARMQHLTSHSDIPLKTFMARQLR